MKTEGMEDGTTEIIGRISVKLKNAGFAFARKPILIGGAALEYCGLRRAGADVDRVISNGDCRQLAVGYPEARKDISGDLGVVIGEFEIWRSIALLDYDFFSVGAIDEGAVTVISLDRLLLTRVRAVEVEKYRKDLELIKNHYYRRFRNCDYLHEAETRIKSCEASGGVIYAGKYD